MLIDTHAHVNFNAFKFDADEVIRRSLDNDVWMINVGSQYKTSKRAVEMAERYENGVYAAIGLHPIHLSSGLFKAKVDKEEIEFKTREEDFNYEEYKKLALSDSRKVVAIGETGLDYWYKPKTPHQNEFGTGQAKIKFEEFKQKQKEVFIKQLGLAQELNLPLIIHCRVAHEDLIEILNSKFQNSNSKILGVIHCFTGSWQEAERYLEMGFYIGFNGIIFKLDLDEVIVKTPLEKMLIETDCPYLTPNPITGRNEPIYVKYVVEKIAKVKKLSYKEISQITTQNARNLFRI